MDSLSAISAREMKDPNTSLYRSSVSSIYLLFSLAGLVWLGFFKAVSHYEPLVGPGLVMEILLPRKVPSFDLRFLRQSLVWSSSWGQTPKPPFSALLVLGF